MHHSSSDLVVSDMQVVFRKVNELDRRWSKQIQRLQLSPIVEYYLAIPTMLFGRHVVPYLIAASFLFFKIHTACFFSLSCLLCVMITEPLKYLVQRERPRKQSTADRVLPIRDDVSNPAFPSGDSAQAAIAAGVLYKLYRWKGVFLLPLPTMFGRVYYGAHWIGDTIGGVLIGLAVSLLLTQHVFDIAEHFLGQYLPTALFHSSSVCSLDT